LPPARAEKQYSAYDNGNEAHYRRNESLPLSGDAERARLHGLTFLGVAHPAKREYCRATENQENANNAEWSH
jgi:hypothetical protein